MKVDSPKNAGTTRPDRIGGLETLSTILDSSIPLGNTGYRIGIDPLIGLFPGIGDAISSLLSAYIVLAAARMGASTVVLTRMLFNIAIDMVIGAIPVLGDVFDFAFKANQRNMEILRSANLTESNRPPEGRINTALVWVFLILVGMFALSIFLIVEFFRMIF